MPGQNSITTLYTYKSQRTNLRSNQTVPQNISLTKQSFFQEIILVATITNWSSTSIDILWSLTEKFSSPAHFLTSVSHGRLLLFPPILDGVTNTSSPNMCVGNSPWSLSFGVLTDPRILPKALPGDSVCPALLHPFESSRGGASFDAKCWLLSTESIVIQ